MWGNKKNKLNKIGAIEILFAANEAIAMVGGLKIILFRGIFVNYLIFFCLTLFLNIFFYLKFLKPFIEWIFGFGEGYWASLGNLVMWSIQLSVSAIITLISLRFSIEFLGFWNQCLVKKILNNFRDVDEKPLSLKSFLNEINYFCVDALKACFFPILLFFLSLIPFIGLPILFVLESHFLGKQCINVYLENLNNLEEIEILKKRFIWLPIRMGWLPSLLTFIPFVGWIFLPLVLTFQVIGFAYTAEISRDS